MHRRSISIRGVPSSRSRAVALALLCATLLPAPAPSREPLAPPPVFASLQPHHLDAGFWLSRADHGQVLLDAAEIERANAALREQGLGLNRLGQLPPLLPAEQVRAWLEPLSALPQAPLFDAGGQRIPAQVLQAILANAGLQALPAEVRPRYALATRRAALRRFPTAQRVFREPGDTDIDRFQESAVFPGTPLALLHPSRDRRWWFVLAPDYAAWIAADAVAIGTREQVLGHARGEPSLRVTGAQVHTVYSPTRPALSKLALDMGTRLRWLRDWPQHLPVDGQLPHAARVIELPQRGDDGRLVLAPALLPRSADVSEAPPALTEANLLRQAFRFLGERYGWGHDYEARDCSGFIADVLRVFGLQLPRNTGDQARSGAFTRLALEGLENSARTAALQSLQTGDLLYLPGHVMMVIGHDAGQTWLIHDTAGVWSQEADGLRRLALNQVSVTPLEPLLDADGLPLRDRIHTVLRLRPPPP